MDINYILFLAALLNLLGDLYNIVKLRHALPRWIPFANLVAVAACGVAWAVAPLHSGFIALGVLLAYVTFVRLRSKTSVPRTSLPSRYTKILIALNVIAYVYQISHDSFASLGALVRAGALYVPLLEQGEWWRLFTAQFLHWGILHILFNMLGLWVLGPAVESRLGGLRFLATYLLCGAGGMLIASLGALIAPEPEPTIMLGASASVLSLVGISAALALREHRHTGSIAAKAQLASMVQIVVLQAIFDSMVPEVSSTAHLGGAACGFIFGTILQAPRGLPRTPQRDF